MNQDFFEQLKKLRQSIVPRQGWVETTRERLMAYMSQRPLIHRQPARLTFVRYGWVFASAFLILLVGSLSAAASASLPGDTLYSWKVGINEPVESLFALGMTEQAQFQVTLVDRRLTEVAEVVARGGMSDKNAAAARNQLEVQTTRARTQIERVASENSEVALATAVDLGAKLKAHRELIHLLEPSTTDGTQVQVRDTISNIEQTSHALATSITALEKKNQDTVAATASADDQKNIVENKIAELDKRITTVAASMKGLQNDNPIILKANEQFTRIQASQAHIHILINQKKYIDAFKELQMLSTSMADIEALLSITTAASDNVLHAIAGDSDGVLSTTHPTVSPQPSIVASGSASFSPTISVATDKTQYVPGENMIVQIEASNTSSASFILKVPNDCQAEYSFDARLDSINRVCSQQVTSLTIAPKSSRAWIFKIQAPIKIGTHTVYGEVYGYGSGESVFGIFGSITSPSATAVPTPLQSTPQTTSPTNP